MKSESCKGSSYRQCGLWKKLGKDTEEEACPQGPTLHSFPRVVGPSHTLLPYKGIEVSSGIILEVLLTLLCKAPLFKCSRKRAGQPFPGAESLGRAAATVRRGVRAGGTQARPPPAAPCALQRFFPIRKVINDGFSKTMQVYTMKSNSSHNPSLWCIGFYNSSIHK